MSVSRRRFLSSAPVVLAPVLWSPSVPVVHDVPDVPDVSDPSFPTQPADLVREMVGVSHNNLVRVKELLARHPTLARASWDWGFGDWEDALGAASHVGNREIAETLLAHGARPTIFSAAMFGQVDVVRAFVAASPGIEATPGPHGITLLRHAVAGGPRAQAVADYLKTLPDADKRPATQPISSEDMAALTGEYLYGAGADERILIATSNNALTFARSGRIRLGHVGDRVFYPAGAPKVQIKFRSSAGRMTLTVHDPDLVLEARRAT